jgi:hypothetical protein
MNKTQRNQTINEIIDNKLSGNIPPRIRLILDRLISEGFSEAEAKKMIIIATSVINNHRVKYHESKRSG